MRKTTQKNLTPANRASLPENLYPIERNGMHGYNNTDHSMLTAMMAIDKIIHGDKDKTSNLGDQYRRRVS